MKLILKIFISVIFITLTVRVPVDGYEINNIKEELVQIGLPQEICENVIDYIDNLDITEEKLQEVIEEGQNITTLVWDKRSVNDFTNIELYNLYNDSTKIANDLNLDLKYDLKEKKATLKDKITGNILFQGGTNELNTYYKNYIKISGINGEKSDLIAYIKDNINNQQDNKTNYDSKKNEFRPIYYLLIIVVILLIYALFRKKR